MNSLADNAAATDKPTSLPPGWVETIIGEMCDVKGGKRLPKGEKLTNEDTGFPYLRVSDFTNFGTISTEKLLFLRPEAQEKIKRYTISHDDVYVSIAGTIGKSGIIPRELSGANLTENAAKLIFDKDKLSAKFLLHFTYSLLFKSQVEGAIKQVAQPKLALKRLAAMKIPLPPLAEQRRIVAKLDALMARHRRSQALLDRVPEQLKQFRQAVLARAVSGELTADWREGRELPLQSIKDTKNEDEYSIIAYPKLDKSWLFMNVGDFATCSRGKFTARPRNDPQFFGGVYPFMQIGDLPRSGGFSNSYSKTLNEKGIKVSKSFPKDTVVIAIVGATIGNTGVLTREMYFPDSLIGINTGQATSNYFLEYFFRVVKNGLREISYAGGGQPNIKIPTIKNLMIAVPSFPEQHEIVRRVQALFRLADRIEARYQALRERFDQVPQAMLAKAFRGELVPQDPADEPAEVLLARIREAQAAMEGKQAKKKKERKKKT